MVLLFYVLYSYRLADNNSHFHHFILFFIFDRPTAQKRLRKDLPSRESTEHGLSNMDPTEGLHRLNAMKNLEDMYCVLLPGGEPYLNPRFNPRPPISSNNSDRVNMKPHASD